MVMVILLLFLLRGTICQQVVDLEPIVRPTPGGNGEVAFKATINVLLSRKNMVSREFILDTSSQVSVLSGSNCKPGSNAFNFSFEGRLRDGLLPVGPVAVPVAVVCSSKKNAADVAALGSGSSSLPSQVAKFNRLPSRFAYCLDQGNRGQLSFGRKSYTLFNNSDVLLGRSLSFLRTSLAVSNNPRAGSTTYLLQLKKLAFSSESLQVKEIIQIGTTSRFTVLPNAAYDFVRQKVEREAVKRKLSRKAAQIGPLSVCYTMSPTQMSSFPLVGMELEGKALWKITPSNYLAPLSQKKNNKVFCLGFLKAGTGASVIGTLQQENFYVEFDEGGKTLRFTEPLLQTYKLGCSQTRGS